MNFSVKWICIAIAALCIVYTYSIHYKEFNPYIKFTLESNIFSLIIWALPPIIFTIHYLREPNRDITSNFFITNKYGNLVDHFGAAIGHSTAIGTSCTILKGIFIQKYIGGTIYFLEFDQIDLYALGLLMFYLLHQNTIIIFDTMKVALRKNTQAEITTL